jgi:hypothetical protein
MGRAIQRALKTAGDNRDTTSSPRFLMKTSPTGRFGLASAERFWPALNPDIVSVGTLLSGGLNTILMKKNPTMSRTTSAPAIRAILVV